MKTIIALLLMGSVASAGEISSAGSVAIGSATPSEPRSLVISLGTNQGPMVTIKADGTIEYGKNYTPDAAAKQLWDAVGVERKARNCQ